MELDYQQLQVDSENITIGWIYNISTCEVDHFMLEAFNFSNIINNMEPVSSYNSTINKITLPSREIHGKYIKLSIFNSNGVVCGRARRTFYHLYKGKHIA